jgi:hypothetical protein
MTGRTENHRQALPGVLRDDRRLKCRLAYIVRRSRREKSGFIPQFPPHPRAIRSASNDDPAHRVPNRE